MKELYIDKGVAQSRACILEDGKILDLYVENHDDRNISGNIFLGRVENIVESLNAAFVNIGTGKNAILHFEDITSKEGIRRGSQLLVQVIRESSGDKGPRISTKLSIPGRNIVFLPGINYIGISKKITSEFVRKSLRKLASEIISEDGIIIRTEAEFEDIDTIKEEYTHLRKRWNRIKETANFIKAPKLIFDSRDFFDFLVREFVKHDIGKIIVNSTVAYNMLRRALPEERSDLISRIILDEYDFSKVKFLKKVMLNLVDEKICLDSGGYILINESDAFVSVDVNSGSFINGITQQETFFKVNIDACKEIAKIIKLRNLSGIIIIDFIDMASDEQRECVIETMDAALKGDRALYKIYGFTKLGLLEMTRARKGKRTLELIFENKNQYNTSFLLKEIENECALLSRHTKKTTIDVFVNEKIISEINTSHFNYISLVREMYGVNINFIVDKNICDYVVNKNSEQLKKVKIELLNRTITGNLDSLEEDEESITVRIFKG